MDIVWRAVLETLASLVRRSLGFAIVIFAFIVLALTGLGVDKAFADESYYRDHGWPKFLAMVIAATPIYLLGAMSTRARASWPAISRPNTRLLSTPCVPRRVL